MVLKSQWAARATRNCMLLIALPLTAVCLLNGCRSNSFSDLASTVDVTKSAAEDASATPSASSVPSYAQGGASGSQGDSPAVQLASAQINSNDAIRHSASTVNLVTLRTLGASDDFQQLVNDAPGVVMVDFYADWCGPCRKQGKVLHELESFAEEHQAQIIKVDVDQHKAIAKQFDVGSLPTLVVIKDGKVVERKVGLTNESRLRAMLQ